MTNPVVQTEHAALKGVAGTRGDRACCHHRRRIRLGYANRSLVSGSNRPLGGSLNSFRMLATRLPNWVLK